jgi:AraC-like DNA-binding protein
MEATCAFRPVFKSMLLRSYPELRTRNRDVVEAALKASGYSTRVELPAGSSTDKFIVHKAAFKEVGLTFIRYDSPVTIEVNPSNDILIGFQIRKVSEVALHGQVIENTVSDAGCLIPNQSPWSVRNPSGYQVLMLRVATESLRRKLSALLGTDRVRLDLRQPSGVDRVLRDASLNFARELDVVDRKFLPALVANSTEDICNRMLTCLSEQYLEAERSPAAPSAVQIGRVEQYIVANYAKPLTVETLAEISGVSARSVFRHFRSRYDCTPHQYLERIRLEMSYVQLLACRDQNAVGFVALDCGFQSLRHFEQAFRNQFGERPVPKQIDRPRRRRR